jgi:hypothetical protein
LDDDATGRQQSPYRAPYTAAAADRRPRATSDSQPRQRTVLQTMEMEDMDTKAFTRQDDAVSLDEPDPRRRPGFDFYRYEQALREWKATRNWDRFFSRLYRYYADKGIFCVVMARTFNLL